MAGAHHGDSSLPVSSCSHAVTRANRLTWRSGLSVAFCLAQHPLSEAVMLVCVPRARGDQASSGPEVGITLKYALAHGAQEGFGESAVWPTPVWDSAAARLQGSEHACGLLKLMRACWLLQRCRKPRANPRGLSPGSVWVSFQGLAGSYQHFRRWRQRNIMLKGNLIQQVHTYLPYF